MCGVVSIVYGNYTKKIGSVASDLLRDLEYRGYDSTGGAFFKKNGKVTLRKKVGAPSKVVKELEIERLGGFKFIGQVRWATYGAVTDNNAQPHHVLCKVEMVGAHNGNISNTDSLKEFLIEQGHSVASDNDGEMLVHLIEHFYHLEVIADDADDTTKIEAMKKAVRKAQKKVVGSYAACITLPTLPGVFAIKAGSSLYAGKGHDENGDFIAVSSDLTSILSKTRFLIQMSEGDVLYFTSNTYVAFSLKGKKEWEPKITRSRLNTQDVGLQPKYHFFMEQEIFSSAANLELLERYYFNNPDYTKLYDIFEKSKDKVRDNLYALLSLYDVFNADALKEEFERIVATDVFKAVFEKAEELLPKKAYNAVFRSEETALLDELMGMDESWFKKLYMIDHMLIWKKKRMVLRYRDKFLDLLKKSLENGGRIYMVASGTSYHAALVASTFFNGEATIPIIPANPGQFRSSYLASLSAKDVVIGISQSGETKDLVDIYNDIENMHGKKIVRITIVNNENSTLPQEKSDFYLPVMCGPEIAVAATKSFTSQVALFYLLAMLVKHDEALVQKKLTKIRSFIEITLNETENMVNNAALNLYMKPSMHILGTSHIGLANEGALKIREVVLNHTQGYDSSEFKHGPNTILGKNTIFGLPMIERLQSDMTTVFEQLFKSREKDDSWSLSDFFLALKTLKVSDPDLIDSLSDSLVNGSKKLSDAVNLYASEVNTERYFSNYPLLFVCGPDERDKRITISQIHTHKIRGADIFLIAEPDRELEKAVSGVPDSVKDYTYQMISLPKSGDKNIFVFQAIIVLQLLSLRMSIAKMKYLNRMKVQNHGVHPDVPKNVSKSITVD
ncbi:SIS domain-containing protein [bacterium]|nr:SIS domain-containing protein [bacterium]